MTQLPRLDRTIARDDAALLRLPEKAVQFGTGAFLRGFVESFIDAANRRGEFGGRIVAIGSTGSGRDRVLNEQNGLFTLAVRGMQNGALVSKYQLITSLSRALSAVDEWQAVLATARDPNIELVFSNTTETGIRLDEPEASADPPQSFPGKLTRFLFERAKAFDFARGAGVIVLPCELIENNGDRLKEIVIALTKRWSLGDGFERWIVEAVHFCNTLVDRIVPGEPAHEEKMRMWQELGYCDELLTVAEAYRLYAIEAAPEIASRLTFTKGEQNIIVADDISAYRERKVRLLNGTHTISVPVALLAGCETVSEAVEDDDVGAFIRRVLLQELVASTTVAQAESFAHDVLDRFANPYIRHDLQDITLQQTMKLRVRIVPAISDYFNCEQEAPAFIAFGFAAFLLVVRDERSTRADDGAAQVRELWRAHSDAGELARAACSARELWGADLAHHGFEEMVADALRSIEANGVRQAVRQLLMAARP